MKNTMLGIQSLSAGYGQSASYRAPDPACNPYLAFSVMLDAGMKGIVEDYPVQPPVQGNVFQMTEERRQSLGIKELPASLGEAIALAERSDLLPEALGDHIFNSFLENKRIEWRDYRATVTDFEVSRYLPIL